MNKICSYCNISQSLDCFHKNKNYNDGYMNSCKTCRSTYRKKKTYKKTIIDTECMKCKKILSPDNFHCDKSSTNGLQSYCKECQKINETEYYKKGGKELFLKRCFKDLKSNAKKRNIDVDITLKDILDLYKKNENCSISGIKMTTEYIPREGKWSRIHNLSVDRIDSKKSYTKDNIQLVCGIVNIMKWDLKQDDFIDICHKIVENEKLKKK